MSGELMAAEQEYLTFKLDSEEFGVDILSVQEIRVWTPVTAVPGTPDYLKGVINLRGVIVPIVDLHQRFSNRVTEYDATTVVIVLKGRVGGKDAMVGIVVDEVSDVYKIEGDDIKDAPDLGNQANNCFVTGMATINEKIIILLDSIKLLDVEELFCRAESLSLQAS